MLRCSSEAQFYRGSGDMQELPLGVSGVCVCVYVCVCVCVCTCICECVGTIGMSVQGHPTIHR